MMTAETPTRRPPGWLWLLLLASVAPLLAEQRIFTNLKPESHFKAVMPGAVAFSSFAGTPLHWKAYDVDPAAHRGAEPYGYFSVEPAEFAAQFRGKSVFDRFVVGSDIDAVSRASISVQSGTRAVRDSVRVAARAF